jgi:hypothetical protein
MSRKIKLTKRESLINDIWMAEKRLREYDRFFKKLKEGQKLLEYGMYDDFDVKVVSWNKEEGTIIGKWKEGGVTKSRTFKYGELHKKTRNLVF